MIFKHIPTGKIYNNRLEAKIDMGTSNYNKAMKRCEMSFYNSSLDKFMTIDEFHQYMTEENRVKNNPDNNNK